MANARSGNVFYADTASSGGTAASFIAQPGIRIAGIILTSAASGDNLIIKDLNAAGTAAGTTKLNIKNSAANITTFLNFIDCPVTFANGIWVDTITSGAFATLILATTG